MRSSRLLRRGLMLLVGLLLLAFYLLVAYGSYRLFGVLWAGRPAPETLVVLFGGLTLLSGYLSYRVGTTRLLQQLGAVQLSREEAPGLYRRLDGLCDRYDIAPPLVLVADLPSPNAFALGDARGGALVFDRTLLRLLDGDEVEAILAHELAHLESYDALLQTLAYSALRTVTGVVSLLLFPFFVVVTGLARAAAWMAGRPWSWPSTVFGRLRFRTEQLVLIVLSVLTLALLAQSRRREYAADERAAAMTGKPVALARALRKIQHHAELEWGLLSLLYVGGEEEPWADMLSTHPSTDDRIERLLERAERNGRRLERAEQNARR